MMEGPQQVLPCPEVHAGLATNGCIYLGKNRGWNLHQLHTAHVKRGQQPSHIADHATAKRDQNRFAVSAEAGQSFGQRFDGPQLLGRFSVGHLDYLRLEACRVQRANQLCAPAPAYGRDGYHEYPAGLRQQLREQAPGPRQKTVFNAGLVGPRRDMDGDLGHGNSIIAYGHCGFDRTGPGSDTICPFMKGLPAETDFIVLGAGVAGLRAAIELADAGRVLLLAKKQATNSSTPSALDEMTAALSDEEEVILHLQDTLIAGDGLCRPEAVKILVEEGPERIEELIA